MESNSACICAVSRDSLTILSTLLSVGLSNCTLVSRGLRPWSTFRAYSKVSSARAIGTRMVRVEPLCHAALNRECLIESSCPLGFGIMIGKIRVLPCVMGFNQYNGVVEYFQARDTRLFIILLHLNNYRS